MTTIIRSLITLKFAADIPRDYISNTVYHSNTGVPFTTVDYDGHALEVCNAFDGSSPDDPSFTATAGIGVNVKCYDMADAEPRPVKGSHSNALWSSGAVDGTFGVPQVALCLSYFCGRNLKHLRGHIYVGPLHKADLSRRPSTALMNEVLALGDALYNIGGADVTHVLHRPTTGDTADITDYWVDDSWDIQRRRQLKGTARVSSHH